MRATSKLMRSKINDLAARAGWVWLSLAEGRILTASKVPRISPGLTGSAVPSLVAVKLGDQRAYCNSQTAGSAISRFFRRPK
ncbi:MAG: hypothetical protein H7238_13480 [Polaromonas sp.]|nr:hypothetical protein [Polaromonas sp.]